MSASGGCLLPGGVLLGGSAPRGVSAQKGSVPGGSYPSMH